MLANETAAETGKNPSNTASPAGHRGNHVVDLLGVAFDNVSLFQTLDRIGQMIASGRQHYVATANVDFVVRARRDPEFRRALQGAHMILCDGTPLLWVSRWFRKPLCERVAGSDLVLPLLQFAAEKKHRVFFLGTTPEINQRAVNNVRRQFPGIIVDHYSPPFRPLHEMDNDDIARRIHAAEADIVLVAFGSPKAELWMAANHQLIGAPVMIGVGATIDFLAGHVKRAPLWMRRTGTEWIFRLAQEPRRLFGRYMTDLWHFSQAVGTEWWNQKSSAKNFGYEHQDGKTL